MALLLPVLVRGINNLSDARYCAGMGADGLIFTLDPSLPGAVTPELVKELAGWVSGVELIGEFGSMPVAEINRLISECGLSRVLISFLQQEHQPTITEPLTVPALVEIFQVQIVDGTYNSQVSASLQASLPAGFQLVCRAPTTGSTSSYEPATRHFPLWFSGEMLPTAATELARQLRPAGLILQGGDEIKPGLRDFTELEAIFEALEAD